MQKVQDKCMLMAVNYKLRSDQPSQVIKKFVVRNN